jgi:hypothetical protein
MSLKDALASCEVSTCFYSMVLICEDLSNGQFNFVYDD